ncbi:MAG: signal peptidase I [Eubacteriales bacterium]|jgi:signal peptidase
MGNKESKRYIKAVNSLLVMFVLVSLALAVFVAFLRGTGARVGFCGINLFRIVSGSMEPVYNTGDYIITVKTDAEKLHTGDIIAFVDSAGEVIVHRIYEVSVDRSFLTRGDANPVGDMQKVFAEQIIGRVVFELPVLGYVDRIIQDVGGFILLIVLPILAIVAVEAAGLISTLLRRRSLRRLIIQYGLDPEDEELCKLIEKYGEDALRRIAVSQGQNLLENKDKIDKEVR